MTTMMDQKWEADPNQPGRVVAGDAITIQVKVDFWRVSGGPDAEMRLVRETEALCLAAPNMAKALLLNGQRNPEFADSAWHTHDCWDNRRASCSEACKATVAAPKKAGVTP